MWATRSPTVQANWRFWRHMLLLCCRAGIFLLFLGTGWFDVSAPHSSQGLLAWKDIRSVSLASLMMGRLTEELQMEMLVLWAAEHRPSSSARWDYGLTPRSPQQIAECLGGNLGGIILTSCPSGSLQHFYLTECRSAEDKTSWSCKLSNTITGKICLQKEISRWTLNRKADWWGATWIPAAAANKVNYIFMLYFRGVKLNRRGVKIQNTL